MLPAHALGTFGYLGQWGGPGSGNGKFQAPFGIATDASGNVYVADCMRHDVQKFDQSGLFLTKWGSGPAAGNGQCDCPRDVAVDASGVYVVDYYNNRVQKFDTTGGYLSQFDNDNNALPYENANYAPIGVEQLALEPDNQFLRVGIDGGWNFDMRTRLSWFADWSRGEQDEDFLPVVLDTNYYPSVNPVFPFSNLDGEVERANVKLSLAGRPFSRFDYRVQYAYKDRDARHDPLPVNELSYTYNSSARLEVIDGLAPAPRWPKGFRR